MKVAALDLGTNSFLCLIAEVQNGEIKKVFSDQVEVVRLGQDVNKTKMFHPEALQRAKASLSRFSHVIKSHKPDRVLAMATSAARDVKNAEELFKIGKDLGIPIEIIPGEKEAEITFSGATSGLAKNQTIRAVIDIGGGSTEIIAGTSEGLMGGASVNIGAVRLTEMFFATQPPSIEQVLKCEIYIKEQLKSLIEKTKAFHPTEFIAVAGTPTELAAAAIGEFDPAKIDGYRFSLADLQAWRRQFEKTSAQQRIEQFRINKGRADVILAGTLILEITLDMLGESSLGVSTRGVRYGVALELEKRK